MLLVLRDDIIIKNLKSRLGQLRQFMHSRSRASIENRVYK